MQGRDEAVRGGGSGGGDRGGGREWRMRAGTESLVKRGSVLPAKRGGSLGRGLRERWGKRESRGRGRGELGVSEKGLVRGWKP